jgi:hypothetical protein
MRERLATKTHLFVSTDDSAGTITAQRRTRTGWVQSQVNLALEGGALVASADDEGNITLHALELGFQAVTIPSTVLGREAKLTNLKLGLGAPIRVMATWNGDDEALTTTPLDMAMSWSLAVGDTQLQLGSPKLPPLSTRLALDGDGHQVSAELRVHASGDLWSWADLVKLSDFDLVLDAQTATVRLGLAPGR